MLARTLLIVGLLGWASCPESQVMSPEEKSVIRCRSVFTLLHGGTVVTTLCSGFGLTNRPLLLFCRDQILEMFDHAYGSYMVRCLHHCTGLRLSTCFGGERQCVRPA